MRPLKNAAQPFSPCKNQDNLCQNTSEHFFQTWFSHPPFPVVNVEAPFELGTCEQQPTLTLWGKGGIFWGKGKCSNLFDKDCVRNEIFKKGCLQKIGAKKLYENYLHLSSFSAKHTGQFLEVEQEIYTAQKN